MVGMSERDVQTEKPPFFSPFFSCDNPVLCKRICEELGIEESQVLKHSIGSKDRCLHTLRINPSGQAGSSVVPALWETKVVDHLRSEVGDFRAFSSRMGINQLQHWAQDSGGPLLFLDLEEESWGKERDFGLGAVAHACHPSSLGGQGRRITRIKFVLQYHEYPRYLLGKLCPKQPVRWGFSMLVRLVSNSRPQAIHTPQPPKDVVSGGKVRRDSRKRVPPVKGQKEGLEIDEEWNPGVDRKVTKTMDVVVREGILVVQGMEVFADSTFCHSASTGFVVKLGPIYTGDFEQVQRGSGAKTEENVPPGEGVGLVSSGKEWDKRNLGLLQLCYHTAPPLQLSSSKCSEASGVRHSSGDGNTVRVNERSLLSQQELHYSTWQSRECRMAGTTPLPKMLQGACPVLTLPVLVQRPPPT
ncbi:hypothetical protein AAY473_002338 [Plecturocebus cupreus]